MKLSSYMVSYIWFLTGNLLPASLFPGYDNMATRFSMQSQNTNLNNPTQYGSSSFPLQNQLPSTSHHAQFQRSDNVLALGPAQSTTSSFQNIGTPNLNYRGVEDYFTEEEIRLKSHEMLENDDMQHLLRIFSMGGGHGHSSVNVTEDGYPYPSAYTPSLNYNFDYDRTRTPGKAVVGWLKLKAALRWGIFIRKKAAERRAQLVELDDS